MRNIAHKINTLRTAVAACAVKMQSSTVRLVQDGKAPKGDPLPIAKVAAIMAAKKTSDIIPYCHPLLVDAVTVEFDFGDDTIGVEVSVTAVAKTGVEMEALTAASVAALTLYDMLKPVDESMEILGCRLLEKKGGKSNFPLEAPKGLKAGVVVVSDRASTNPDYNTTGSFIVESLTGFGISDVQSTIVSDEVDRIYDSLIKMCDDGCHLVLTTGGTGLGPRDVTVEATDRAVEIEVPGITEAVRAYGQNRTPYAMLSRGKAGLRGRTLIINLPGSPRAVEEGIAAIFPAVFHSFAMMAGRGH